MLALTLALAGGCQTESHKRNKIRSTLRLHIEINRDTSDRSSKALVYRQHPISLTIEKLPFLTEAHVKEASVVDAVGGFSMQIQFNKEGSLLLEEYTTGNRDRHLAIQSQFTMPSDPKLAESRWLAAPKIMATIKDGLLTFTPDASRAEADQIVLGLNNLATQRSHDLLPKW